MHERCVFKRNKITDMAVKKIKKVDTPIDQRETFVSIQKNFADGEISAQEKLKTLWDLQQADTAIDKIHQLRGELPGEVTALEEELADLKAKAKACIDFMEGMNVSVTNYKQNIVECDNQVANYQKQLENITNSREFDSLNKEIENLGILRQIAEKNIGEAKVKLAQSKSDLEAAKEAVSVKENDLKLKREELSSIVDSTAKQEAELMTARAACAAKIDARTMSAYERIRASVHNHLAVVSVYDGDSCGGCFNSIIPQRLVEIASNKKLIICEHCGRILMNPDFSE